MTQLKALAFDVGGSVFDWKTAIHSAVKQLAASKNLAIDHEAFAMAWRLQFFIQIKRVHDNAIPHVSADILVRAALEEVLKEFPDLKVSDEERQNLLSAWHQMKSFEDFPPALKRLKEKYKVYVLTVLSFSMVADSSKHSGITWDGIISCEFLSAYKQRPEAYLEGCAVMGLEPEEVAMVAVHPSDLNSASKTGMKMCYAEPQLREPDVPGLSMLPEYDSYFAWGKDFEELADKLCGPNA
jgi:2-haloacid dehalogenase